MSILKIVVVTLFATLTTIECSVIAPPLVAPLPAVPAFRYTHISPPSVLPFSAQVSTFTRNLHVFDAPYAAGVIPGPPPIVQRALLPAPIAPLHPAPFLPSHVAPAPIFPAPTPFLPAPVAPFPAAAPVLPYAGPAPILPYAGPAPVLPYAGGVPGWPFAGGLVAPVARSVHAVAPHVAPVVGPAPLLG